MNSPPPQLSFYACEASSFSEVALKSHSLSNCLPVGLLRDTWTWRDIFTGTPLLVSLESWIQASNVSFKLNARGTPAELFELTHPPGKIPLSTMLPKCSTSRHFLKGPAATTKNFFTNVTGLLGTTSARVPAPTRAGPNF